METIHCIDCNEPVNGNYCSNCGQPAELKRIDGHYIIREIASILYAERGMLYTLKKLLINPGESIRHYITKDRRRCVKPVTFIIITSLTYTLVCQLFHIDSGHFYSQEALGEMELPTFRLILDWIINYQGYANLIAGLFVAFLIKLFFRKSGYNLSEIFILLCYVSGITVLLHSIVVIFQAATHWNLMNMLQISNVIALIYFTWAAVQFFGKKKAVDYVKAFLSYGFGMFIFGFLTVFVAIFIDIISK